jgi:hypothetical protein
MISESRWRRFREEDLGPGSRFRYQKIAGGNVRIDLKEQLRIKYVAVSEEQH